MCNRLWKKQVAFRLRFGPESIDSASICGCDTSFPFEKDASRSDVGIHPHTVKKHWLHVLIEHVIFQRNRIEIQARNDGIIAVLENAEEVKAGGCGKSYIFE